ncbi:MAG TPA: hypothetical protein DD670_14715 [Planctomycetaceae bacterium]|nr:hypothetical protein [Planctomycetaceae bacterium]
MIERLRPRCIPAVVSWLFLAGFDLAGAARAMDDLSPPRAMPASEPYSLDDFQPLPVVDLDEPDDSPARLDPSLDPSAPSLELSLDPSVDRSPLLLASNPEATTQFELPLEKQIEENIWDRPIDARNGFFQEMSWDNTWLCGGSAPHHFGMFETEVRGTFALPLPTRRHPLLLMPGFAAYFLEGPKGADLPPRLYDAYVQLRWLHKLSPRWSADLSVTPGIYSDFEQSSDEAFRISGHFGAMFDWTPTTKIALGVVYLDRDDYRVLPFAGVIWEPSRDLIVELMVPRPQVSRRVYWHGAMTDETQDWLYIAGELGGGTWAIRADEAADTLTYSDLRLIVGLKRNVLFGVDYRVEMAYVFARKIKFRSDTPQIDPTDTIMLRAGMTY